LTDKQRFFALGVNDRRRIGYLVAGMAVVHIAQFWVTPADAVISRWGGIAVNVLALVWSLRPDRAPSFWFALLPYAWFIAAMFEGWEVVRGLQESRLSISEALSAVNLLMLPFLAGPLWRFYKLSDGVKATPDLPRSM
jgi:hypothetical protein